MNIFFVTILTIFSVAGVYSDAGHFCYDDTNPSHCGPRYWSGQCQSESRQSPINIPRISFANGVARLRLLETYKSPSFKLKNTGNTVQIEYSEESSEVFEFPDPLDESIIRGYKFASAHLHWGPAGSKNGSEHCVQGKCSQMELHLVHYNADYSSVSTALESEDESALAVLGVLINANAKKANPSLASILKHLQEITEPDSTTSVPEKVDFTQLLVKAGTPQQVYTYKGSLTTPGCNEQVNWYVLREPAEISSNDLKKFRTSLKNNLHQPMTLNYRKTMPLNERQVNLRMVHATE